MIGMTHKVSRAPPVSTISTVFMATSIDTMEINDIPIAVLKARLIVIWRLRITVSSAMDVSKPFTIANDMMARVGHGIPVNWKNAMVPMSPMAQPKRHHRVFIEACFQIGPSHQLSAVTVPANAMSLSVPVPPFDDL